MRIRYRFKDKQRFLNMIYINCLSAQLGTFEFVEFMQACSLGASFIRGLARYSCRYLLQCTTRTKN